MYFSWREDIPSTPPLPHKVSACYAKKSACQARWLVGQHLVYRLFGPLPIRTVTKKLQNFLMGRNEKNPMGLGGTNDGERMRFVTR